MISRSRGYNKNAELSYQVWIPVAPITFPTSESRSPSITPLPKLPPSEGSRAPI